MPYIDKAKLMSHIERESRKYGEEYDAYQIMSDIEDFPIADVVEKERYDRLLENANILADAVRKYQTADVAEVKHGKWIRQKAQHSVTKEIKNVITCSECDSTYIQNEFDGADYEIPYFCPHCGADMRKEGGAE